jgi:N-acetylmuramoyl-L-alanine amidase
MKIFIAAGHGGTDPGSTFGSVIERDETIKLIEDTAAILRPIIKAPDELIIVPHDLALNMTVDFINARTTAPTLDICIELHFNNNAGTPGTGTETYYGYKKLADRLQKSIVEKLGLKDRGVKDGSGMYFNKYTKPYSALVEIGFLNNPGDFAKVRAAGALALAVGIAAYIGINLTTVPGQTQPPEDWKTRCQEAERKVKFVKDSLTMLFVQL